MTIDQRHLKYHGDSATLVNFSKTGEDDYGDPNYSKTETNTQVLVVTIGASVEARLGESGRESTADVRIFVDDDETVHDGTDGVPTEIQTDFATYEVEYIEHIGHGLLRCFCIRR